MAGIYANVSIRFSIVLNQWFMVFSNPEWRFQHLMQISKKKAKTFIKLHKLKKSEYDDTIFYD